MGALVIAPASLVPALANQNYKRERALRLSRLLMLSHRTVDLYQKSLFPTIDRYSSTD